MAKSFKIETVAWTWAEPVQSKNIYRDDEFVRSKSKEEALEAIDFLMGQARGLTYTITVFKEDEYLTYWRHSMPCLGGLVKYRDSHGSKHFMNPFFPRDIRVAFPEGDIVFIACQRDVRINLKNPYWEFILSKESPWVSAFGNKDTIIFKNNYFVLTNMDTDPTVFYSLMRLGGMVAWYPSQYKNWNPKAELLALKTSKADPRRLAAQKPIRISGGTWADGYGYTRPYNESIFATLIPTRFVDFKNLSGYPQAAYKNTYFVSTMKSEFGVDVSNGVSHEDKKLEKALTEAWDYFKDQGATLSDRPGNVLGEAQEKFITDTIKANVQDFAMSLMHGAHQTQVSAGC